MTPTRPASTSRRRSATSPACATAKVLAFDSSGRRVRDPARPRPALAEFVQALHAQAKRRAAGRRSRPAAKGRRLRLAGMLLRPRSEKLVLAPEYGGDGGKTVGICAEKTAPVAAFPGHWAPERSPDLYRHGVPRRPITTARSSPSTARGIARRSRRAATTSCSSRSRTARPAGDFIVFADGFAGAVKEPGQAAFRPTGLAMAPDGALYISDDKHGRIWRVTYHGAADAALAPAPAPKIAAMSSGEPGPPRLHPDAGRPSPASLPIPPGATREQVALGDRIFHGEAAAAPAPAATVRTRAAVRKHRRW